MIWLKILINTLISDQSTLWEWMWFCLFSDGFLFYHVNRCDFNSTGLKDIEFTLSAYYNKLEIYRFSSSVGKFVGYTEYGVRQAKYFNDLPGEVARWTAEKETYCQHNIGNWYSNILSKSGECEVVCVTSSGVQFTSLWLTLNHSLTAHRFSWKGCCFKNTVLTEFTC